MLSRDNSLNRKEFNELFNVCHDAREKILVILAGNLGLKAGEVAHLKKSWINRQREQIIIPHRQGDWKPKTKQGARAIPFGKMKREKAVIIGYFALNGEIGITRQQIHNKIKQIASRTNIVKKINPYTLRASAAYMFAEAGFSAQALRQLMGWSKLDTAEHYIIQSGRALEIEMEERKSKLW